MRARLSILLTVLSGCLGVVAPMPCAAAEAVAKSTSDSDSKIVAALIAAAGVVISALIAYFGSRSVARRSAEQAIASESRKRQSDLALQVTTLLSEKPEIARQAARRFAVGVIKVYGLRLEGGAIDEDRDFEGKGQLCFVPINGRVTVGRRSDNDIQFTSSRTDVSRYHCGFISEGRDVFVEDYRSLTGTKVNGTALVAGSHRLQSGDKIEICEFVLEFRKVHVSEILAPKFDRQSPL